MVGRERVKVIEVRGRRFCVIISSAGRLRAEEVLRVLEQVSPSRFLTNHEKVLTSQTASAASDCLFRAEGTASGNEAAQSKRRGGRQSSISKEKRGRLPYDPDVRSQALL